MLEEDTSFSGLLNYARLLARRALLAGARPHVPVPRHRPADRARARPAAGASCSSTGCPGKQLFVALLVLPVVISPIIAGATWRLLFDNRFGPINQIIGWIAGEHDADPLDGQPGLRLPGDPHCRGLAVDAVHVPAAAGRAVERRQVAARGGRRSTVPASSAPSRKIILPAIRPVLAIALLIRALDLFRLFDVVWALTKGGPGHDDRDGLDLRLRPGLPAVRDQLRRRDGGGHPDRRQSSLVVLALRRVEIAR